MAMRVVAAVPERSDMLRRTVIASGVAVRAVMVCRATLQERKFGMLVVALAVLRGGLRTRLYLAVTVAEEPVPASELPEESAETAVLPSKMNQAACFLSGKPVSAVQADTEGPVVLHINNLSLQMGQNRYRTVNRVQGQEEDMPEHKITKKKINLLPPALKGSLLLHHPEAFQS